MGEATTMVRSSGNGFSRSQTGEIAVASAGFLFRKWWKKQQPMLSLSFRPLGFWVEE
uniref:Uncharacterized protein n=1 Tax=Nelumbo nucifera TaxID=4432 RepID=A0A822ZYL1_NELNU|nr:TPA_asm: hypothetical protein HUJ06_018548 [Nelumbo nucifera]